MTQPPLVNEIDPLKRINSIIQSKLKVYGAEKNEEIIKGIKNGDKETFCSIKGDNNLIIDLLDSYFLIGIMLTFSHYDYSKYYTYDCYISNDNLNWTPIIEGKQAKANETILIYNMTRYIKFKGKNSSDSNLHIVNFKLI